jgi:uncharacterized membrane protein
MTEVLSIVLSVLVLLGSGITLGVFFAVAVSVSPALFSMPPDQYVEAHQLLGKGYHPSMPIITNITMFGGFGLAALVHNPTATALFLAGAVVVIGIQAVSHLGNVPINRGLKAYAGLPDDSEWTDPRPQWRFWHRIRTALAAIALLANSLGAALLH